MWFWHRLSRIAADPAVAEHFIRFDDFTMSVTSDFTAKTTLQALFNPTNYDIDPDLVMALAVTLASALLALPMARYMARYTSSKMKAFFYIAVMLPMWASYIVKALRRCCWRKMAWRSGSSVILDWRGAERAVRASQRLAAIPCPPRPWTLSGVRLHLAAVCQSCRCRRRWAYSGSLLRASADLQRSPTRQTFPLRGAAAVIPASPLGRSSPFR